VWKLAAGAGPARGLFAVVDFQLKVRGAAAASAPRRARTIRWSRLLLGLTATATNSRQVWVKPELRDDGRVYWTADSDSQLTKGLAALLVLGLSGCTPQVGGGRWDSEGGGA
jgi:hypothetical protein